MMESGKTRRLGRIFRDDGKTVIVPMDHGVPAGPIEGLGDIRRVVNQVAKGGADAVSVHINVGSEHEQNMLDNFSRILDECDDYSMPLLAMMYPRGPKILDEHSHDVVSHAARLGYELGADIVQTNYTGDVESFRDVVNNVRVPIVVAGGPKTNSASECLRNVYESVKGGAVGVSIGRNVFQHQDPTVMTRAIAEIVHSEATPGNAPTVLGEKSGTVLTRPSFATYPRISFAG